MKERALVTWLFAILVVLVAFNLPKPVSKRAKDILREILAPLQQSFTILGRRWQEGVRAAKKLNDLAEQNRRMEIELVYLRNQVRELRALEVENQELRKQLDFARRPERILLPCEVIGRNVSGWWHTVRINRGLADGLKEGTAIITTDGLIGRVLEISAHAADVLLISDPSSKVSARLPRTGAFGIVRGAGANAAGRVSCVMDYLNKDIPILEGDEVVTSGLGGIFPKGLLIGYVERVSRDKGVLYQTAEIVPKADLSLLTYVFAVVEEGAEIEDYLRSRRAHLETLQ